MLKRTAAVLAAAAVVVTAVLTASAGPAAAAPRAAVNLASTIALDDCSASLVRYPTSQNTDRALMLTAGHCFEGGMPSAGQVLQNVASSRSGTLLNSSGSSLGTVRADKLLYATMTNTDVAVYELTDTYASITSRFGATAMTISASHPTSTEAISIPSGYWKRIWSCSLTGFAGTVREDQWTWHDSLRYGLSGCDIIGGSSGSPVVDSTSGVVVGVNNTINESGQMCTLNNPCEVASDGTTTETKGQGYGQETYWITTCLNAANSIDLTVSGCLLPKPPGTGNTVTVTSPGNQTGTVGTAVSLQISASDSASGQTLTYSATGLPAGLAINASTGLISGTPTTAGTGTVTVKATDTTGAFGSAPFTWTVNPVGGGGVTNGTFETGSLTGWTTTGITAASNSGAHSGTYSAMVGSTSPSNTSSIAQTFTAPTGTSHLTFWYNVFCPDTVTYDWATATLKDNTTGTTTTPLAKTCVNPSSGWKQITATTTAGHSYTLTLTSKDDNYTGDPTYTKYDDIAVS